MPHSAVDKINNYRVIILFSVAEFIFLEPQNEIRFSGFCGVLFLEMFSGCGN
jgi:hypothetical protein